MADTNDTLSEHTGIIAWFARNSVAANLLMLLIATVGLGTLFLRTKFEVFPDITLDRVNIRMAYRGATPKEVEEGVVIKIEEAIQDLVGIEKMTSVASEGSGSISVEIEDGHEPREILDDIKNRVDAINTFPADTERPTFSLAKRQREVISAVVAGKIPERELRQLGERVRDDLTVLPEISQVELVEVRPYEISIEVSEQTLREYGLTFDRVVQAVRSSSLDLPAGAIKTGGGEVLLRTRGQAYNKEDFESIVILTRSDGTRLEIGDIANVIDGFEEENLSAFFNGQPCVVLDVYRVGDQDARVVSQVVRDYIERTKHSMPPGVILTYWRDMAKIIRARLDTLRRNGLQGAVLVLILLTLFLQFKVAAWVCVGIPVSFLGAIAIIPEFGVSLNIISLFAFILVLGIVVDDAIVTGENIYTRLQDMPDGTEAAIVGTKEVSVPVTFGVLTTVAAFIPLFMMGGRLGPIWAQIPAIVIPVLLFSLIESKLVLPAHLKHLKPSREAESKNPFTRFQQNFARGLTASIDIFYRPVLHSALSRRYLTAAIFIATILILLGLVRSGRVLFTPFPKVQSEVARCTLTMPLGTPFEVTAGHVARMNAAAEQVRRNHIDPDLGTSIIKNILATPGSAGRSTRGQSHVGRVMFEIIPPEYRTLDVTSSQLVEELRKIIGPVTGAKELSFRAEIGRSTEPIDIRLAGNDFDVLQEITDRVKQKLGEYDEVFDITDSFQDGKEEIQLRMKPEAELLGLSPTILGRQVRQAFFGAEAQRIQRGREDIRVMVRYPLSERRSIGSLEKMKIRAPDGTEVPFGDVADAEMGQGFASIRRIDRMRAISVTADFNKKTGNITAVNEELRLFMDGLISEYRGVSYFLEGEAKEERQSFGALQWGLLFLVFVIYALLAIPFKSYLQPLIVMSVIPFGLMGAIIGHMIMRMNLSMMSIFGCLALVGVVVNDSLVMVDFVNRKRAEGLSLLESVRLAGVARFRAILLTSLTTFAGLMPLLFEKSTQAQFLIPMAVSLGFGVLFATFVTLLMVPVNYLILDDITSSVQKAWKW
ncbi:MAG: efflux RND transporter permease subunit, partial [Planctomycetota bacterium]|nr:efflux RND transporter permease subunit [Planctomycetota bacterium]